MKKKKYLAGLLACLALVSCSPKPSSQGDSQGQDAGKSASVEMKNPLADLKTEIIVPSFEESKVNLASFQYTVEKDLSNIDNLDLYVNEYIDFTPDQKQALVENKFFVDGKTGETQPFGLYEGNEYSYMPNFVTVDSVLHLFHISYDALLRDLEVDQFLPKLKEINQAMATASLKDYEEAQDSRVKEAALRNTAYFAVAGELFGAPIEGDIPQEAKDLAQKELASIQTEGEAGSSLVQKKVDYSQFKPRGHYTRSEDLTRYFKGSMLYSQEGMNFFDPEGKPLEDNAIQALLMAKNLCGDKDQFHAWENVNDPLNFLVENVDDLDPYQIGQVYYTHFSKETPVDDLGQEENLKKVYKSLEKMPKPQIQYYEGQSFRFMPQRAVLDNVLAQMLVDTKEPSDRPIYSGVDIMALLGNPLADKLVEANEDNKKWPDFPKNYKKAKKMAQVLDDEKEGRKNVYRAWMWMLKAYQEPIDEKYPSFMQSDAWKAKDLNSALGSWAQLKHDTILYGKQVGAEMGGGGEELEMPKSYVEPRVQVYDRLLWTLNYMTENLKARDLLTEGDQKNLANLMDLVTFLRDTSIVELEGKSPDAKAQERLFYIGGEMENIFVKFFDEKAESFYDIEEQADRNMATVADLMVTVENTLGIESGRYLEVGSGMAQTAYVVYPMDGKLLLGTGPVYSYYEFLSPERMTDEDFQSKLMESIFPSGDSKEYPLKQPTWTEVYKKDSPDMGY